jgi:hypothetical protein
MQRPRSVKGAITGGDVLVHPLTILRLWGPGVYVRCLRAVMSRQPCTFLALVHARAAPDGPPRV